MINYFNIPIADYEFILKNIKIRSSKKINFLITGGAGFIGKWIIGSLLNFDNVNKTGIKIFLLTRNKKKFLITNKKLSFDKRLNILNCDIIKETIKLKDKIDYIVHLANDTKKDKVNNDKYQLRINIKGTKNIIEFAKKKKIKKIFFSSSGAAYLDKVSAKNIYGIGKKISENLLRFDKKLKNKVIIARLFSFCGPLQPFETSYAFTNFLKNSINSNVIKVYGSGKEIRSYMYVADLTIWIINLLFLRNIKYDLLDVGSDKKISILSLAKEITRLSKSKSKIIIIKSLLNEPKNRYYPNLRKAKEIGLKIYTPLNQAIIKTIEYSKQSKLKF